MIAREKAVHIYLLAPTLDRDHIIIAGYVILLHACHRAEELQL
ncbi:hypothetical protein GCM10017044_04100 [Kordiimonas sediminis]|uniref:Uncharacterized protein n=1 Tax=Kordiimonas sediminis TaxID=1735581 RepID=A0A919AM18_9PROT|nr:hypothetical protein GCM10017044_04100 [Kordiimonas sediminis]